MNSDKKSNEYWSLIKIVYIKHINGRIIIINFNEYFNCIKTIKLYRIIITYSYEKCVIVKYLTIKLRIKLKYVYSDAKRIFH